MKKLNELNCVRISCPLLCLKMTDPPDEIKQNGVKTIMYLRNSLRSSKAYYTVKLMLVGRAEQGKTTLMHRLMRDYTYNINQSTNGTRKCLVLQVQ